MPIPVGVSLNYCFAGPAALELESVEGWRLVLPSPNSHDPDWIPTERGATSKANCSVRRVNLGRCGDGENARRTAETTMVDADGYE